MRMRISRAKSRIGFTLVELMVAVTLIIFIMVILTEAFKAGIDAFRNLKAAGDAAERLRSAANVIRRDLAAPHFEKESDGSTKDGPTRDRDQYLRDQRLDLAGWKPPARGFFRIWQGVEDPANNATAVIKSEGNDSENLGFTRASKHVLHFTSRLNANAPGEYFSGQFDQNHNANNQSPYIWDPLNQELAAFSDTPPATIPLPANTFPPSNQYRYASRWAEIALFMKPTGENATDSNGNTGPALFTLHRRVRLIPRTPTNDLPQFAAQKPAPKTAAQSASEYDLNDDLSISQNQTTTNVIGGAINFNNLGMLTDPRVRMDASFFSTLNNVGGGYRNPTTSANQTRPCTLAELRGNNNATAGDDILLSDVISFEVKAFWTSIRDPNTQATIYNQSNDTDFPFLELPQRSATYFNSFFQTNFANDRVFDTWMNEGILNAALPSGFKMDWNNSGDNLPAPAQTFGYLSTDVRARPFLVPLRIHVKALQIKIRIWDVKTKTTRQVTIVQEV